MRALIADMIENGAVPEYASKKKMTGYDLTLSALYEIENGGGIACESFIDYKKKFKSKSNCLLFTIQKRSCSCH